MGARESLEMEVDERDEFLGTGGTGVMSFSTPANEAPHSIPVSYGYDASEETFYFRLAVSPESRKQRIVNSVISFVIYGMDGDGWKSVIASGKLEETNDEAIATETLQGLQRVTIPLVDFFGKPPGEIHFEFYRLVPDELTGRKESKTPV
ncbi:pyridoxamine 5'-phosphate oxidase family protein [Haladaptatus sp. QDMS2]|uniref:pyridoxamine 5'-phosphate oxidase family protein n=1 Tax=Haladaptatus sp. QDMS2 TaxID=3033391 RepID=UPI0023E7E15C|nr:pyridoxamine 5'-phosphate oxidase family protein [Haladaptatus sp. QDMS2]